MTFDLDRRWRLSEQVALRPEPFGALAYDFGTRRLSFLKSRALLALVEALGAHPSAREAARAVGVAGGELDRCRQALAVLAATGMIRAQAAP